MTTTAQRRATARHRQRASERGLARVEVQVPRENAELIRSLAALLREHPDKAGQLEAWARPAERRGRTWGEYLASAPDVSGPEFDDALDFPRENWPLREVEL